MNVALAVVFSMVFMAIYTFYIFSEKFGYKTEPRFPKFRGFIWMLGLLAIVGAGILDVYLRIAFLGSIALSVYFLVQYKWTRVKT